MLSKNIKRRMLYRREIINLRKIASILMNYQYHGKTTCQLSESHVSFSRFEAIPNIAIFIGTATPFLSYYFIKPITDTLDMGYLTLPIVLLSTLAASSIMINLHSHHRKEYLVALHFTHNKSEQMIKKQIKHIDCFRKKKKRYINYKIIINLLVLVLVTMLIYNCDTSTTKSEFNFSIGVVLEFFVSFGIIFFLVLKARFKNKEFNPDILTCKEAV